MILFSDVIDQLESAEANLMSLVDNKTGVIKREKYNQILTLLNAGLSDIFTKFQVREGACTLQTTEGKYDYVIDKAYAVSVDPVNGYILDDASSPFSNEVIEVTSVHTLEGHSLPFNTMDRNLEARDFNPGYSYDVMDCKRSFSTPKYKTLRTPLGLRSSLLHIKYKVGHDKLDKIKPEELELFDPSSVVIDLPYVYLVPLTYYVISRLSNARGTERAGQGMFNEGTTFYSKYLAECNNIKENLNQSEQTAENSNLFRMRGFI